jgi:hypothetical protein
MTNTFREMLWSNGVVFGEGGNPLKDTDAKISTDSSHANSWSNGNNTYKLGDDDGIGYWNDTSGALKFTISFGWECVFRISTENGGYFESNAASDLLGIGSGSILNMSNYISNPTNADGKTWTDDEILVRMPVGSILEIDIDDDYAGFHKFKLQLPDNTITGKGTFNDEVYITLVSATYKDPFATDETGAGEEIDGGGTYDEGEVALDETEGDSATEESGYTGDTLWEAGLNFSSVSFYDKDSSVVFKSQSKVVIQDNDIPSFGGFLGIQQSGGVLAQVAEGRYVKIKILTEEGAYFNSIKAALMFDPLLSNEDFSSGDPHFTYKLTEGMTLAIDPDLEHGLGGGFYLGNPSGGYAIEGDSDNDWILDIIEVGAMPIPNPDTVCEVGFAKDANGVCVPIGDLIIENDPFSIFDGFTQVVPESDSLFERLSKSMGFGINSSFKAVEVVIEGAFIAMPAIIIIVASVFIAKVIMSLTQDGTEKALDTISEVI